VKTAKESSGTSSKPSAVICDLDGTLCNTDHRQHYLQGQKKDWKGFFGALAADPINGWCRDIIKGLMDRPGYQIIFVTGRPERYQIPTVDWLSRHHLHPFAYKLFMRGDKDKRPDHEVKEEIFRALIEPRWDVRMVIDDRRSVVEMWRQLGLVVLQCAEGNF
jgi:predicted secreted acid phosphatase